MFRSWLEPLPLIAILRGLCPQESVAIGTAIGLTAAFATTRYIQTLLFGVDPIDAATFIATSVVLAATATLACLIPARRAMRVDPVVAFRER